MLLRLPSSIQLLLHAFTTSKALTLSGSLETLLWPQLRSDVANKLVTTGAVGASARFTEAEEAYRQIFTSIPESGNCWSHANKRNAARGPVQDQYDHACKSLHECITAGYLSNLQTEV